MASRTGTARITDMPAEVLAKIFTHLAGERDHQTVREVSKSWARVVDDYLGLAIVVGVKGVGYFVEYPTKPLDRQTIQATLTWTALTRSQTDLLGESLFKVMPKFAEPRKIKKLALVGNIGREYITSLPSSLENLTGLFLHITVFEDQEVFTQSDQLMLAKLKCLVIDDTGIILSTENPQSKVNEIYETVASFLKVNHFRFLQQFNIEFPLYEKKEGVLTNALAGFIQRHSSTLKALTIHQKYMVDDDEEEDEEEKNAENYNDEDDDSESDNENDVTIKMLANNANQLKNVKLEEIYISLADSQETSPLWKNFLTHQTTLKKLFYVNYEIPFPESLVQRNISTLNVLVVNIKTCVNFSCFLGEQCRIRSLVLIGKYRVEPEIDVPDLRNLFLLPDSVEILKLKGVTALTSDIKIIALRKPNLKELVLDSIGIKYHLGMGLETYGLLLEAKKLEYFRVKNSFNAASFTDYARLPKNVEGLSTVFVNSHSGILVEGYLNERKDRYILNSSPRTSEDLEGAGEDAFNPLSGITYYLKRSLNDQDDESVSAGNSSAESDQETVTSDETDSSDDELSHVSDTNSDEEENDGEHIGGEAEGGGDK